MKKTLIMLLLLILSGGSAFSAETVSRKDPLLAGVLSWYMPGLGQFYAGQYLKGSIYWVVENTLFVSAVLTIADLNFSVNKDIGFQFSIKPKKYVSKRDKTIAITLGVSYCAFHVFNVIDAIRTTAGLNREAARERAGISWECGLLAGDPFLGMKSRF